MKSDLALYASLKSVHVVRGFLGVSASLVVYCAVSMGPVTWANHAVAANTPAPDVSHDAHHEPASSGGQSEVSAVRGGRQYSLFMHHTSGWAVLALSALLLADRLTYQRHRLIGISIGCVWLLFGVFLFIRADPEGWPIGPAGFLESFTMPTSGEWLQHKVLSLIPMFLGLYSLGVRRIMPNARKWNYVLAFLAVLGAIGVLSHQHLDHPGMDIVNVQHRLLALTALLTAVSLVQEVWKGWDWKGKNLIFPLCLMILGLQLVFYVE